MLEMEIHVVDHPAGEPAVTMRIGLIVNPIAGMGGAVALKGTDGAEVPRQALALGARPLARERAEQFLARLAAQGRRLELDVAAGAMGERSAARLGIPAMVVGGQAGAQTSAADTQCAARAMAHHGCGLIVFAGGDGTARDMLDAVGDTVPILGIPAGVKMHSAVFATTPNAAAHVVERFFASDRGIEMREMEVMDIDEAMLRGGALSARLHGYARVPFERHALPGPKARDTSEDMSLEGAAAEIVRGMQAGTLYVIGPGTTMRRIKRRLGVEGTLLGVDAFLDRRPAGLDLTAKQLLDLTSGRPAKIVVGITGGQGFVLGRGNQQLSAALVRRVGRDNIIIVASVAKLVALDGAMLRVDSGEPDLDRSLAGFIRVVTGSGETAIARIGEPL